jgi:hypothetical protein
MALTVTANVAGTYAKSWNVVSSADGDVAATVTHGFSAAPSYAILVPLVGANYALKQWAISAINASQILLSATSTTGSGLAATAQVQVIAFLPHSIMA